jgi:hypothetical protein
MGTTGFAGLAMLALRSGSTNLEAELPMLSSSDVIKSRLTGVL